MFKLPGVWCFLIPVFLIVAGFDTASEKMEQPVLRIIIRPVFNQQALVLRERLYHAPGTDSLYIDAFRFYLSAISLRGMGHTLFKEANSYHLVDASDPASLSVFLKHVPPGNYEQLHFNIGIDSLANVSGAMDGDLDPVKGMYWAWNSGYINAKLEGRSNSCQTLHHAFEFHIGGYMKPYNAARPVSLALNKTVTVNDTTTILIDADIAAWLKGVELRKLNSVVMPSKEAMSLADNYAGMFTSAK